MSRWSRFFCMLVLVLLVGVPATFASAQQQAGDGKAILVGRIAHIEGQLLRYVEDEKDWVATVKDAPFGLDDALYSGEDAKAEIVMPNSTLLRIDGSTQVQMIALEPDLTEVDVASGISRFYNKNQGGVVKVTTPFGYVVAQDGTVFDIYAGDESVEVIALNGAVSFVHDKDSARYEVRPGSSVVANKENVGAGEGTVDADWDDWNAARDQQLVKRVQVKGETVKYIPANLEDEAYTLEENGRWERVEYEGQYYQMWRPVRVSAEWAPFTVGRWTEYHGDQCWVPDEPFGYVTHHYGNWVYAGNYWYWAPPVVRVNVGVPLLSVGFGWYPGRVGWIHSGVDVGWVPLAPTEVYYAHRYWGPRAVIVNNVGVSINIGHYRYVDHAIVVNQRSLYSVNNYSTVRIRNINHTTIINNYRAAPIVNERVVRDYNTNRQRYNFTNVNVDRKPHDVVVNRIERNRQIATRETNANARAVENDLSRVRKADLRPDNQARIESPRKVTNKMVDPASVNKPASDVQFRQKDLKPHTKPVDAASGDNRLQGPQGRQGRTGADTNEAIPRPPKPGRDNQLQGTDQQQERGPASDKRIRREDRGGAAEMNAAPDQGTAGSTDRGHVRPPKPGREPQGADQSMRAPGGDHSGSREPVVREPRYNRDSRHTGPDQGMSPFGGDPSRSSRQFDRGASDRRLDRPMHGPDLQDSRRPDFQQGPAAHDQRRMDQPDPRHQDFQQHRPDRPNAAPQDRPVHQDNSGGRGKHQKPDQQDNAIPRI